ncbi:MAG TPA: hypothetical protein VGU20_21125 [Stellaceae bacterium]|nr:hypothetical protein [Stellaceae bacterium]
MEALAAAFFTAAIALLGKIFFDLWNRQHERRGIAGALAGEIGAYISFFEQQPLTEGYRKLAAAPRNERVRGLSSMMAPPSGHPVFDKLAGQLGRLSPARACEVSRFYNVATGLRLLLAHLSSPKFLEADDRIQQATLEYLAAGHDKYVPLARALVTELEDVARESVWSVMMVKLADARRRLTTHQKPTP